MKRIVRNIFSEQKGHFWFGPKFSFKFVVKGSFSVGKRRRDLGLPATNTVVYWLDEGKRAAFPGEIAGEEE